MPPAKSPSRPVIAHVLHRLYLAGAEVLAADLSRQLRDRFDFVFLCLDEIGPLGQTLAGEGFPVVNLERKPGVDLALAKRLRHVVGAHHVQLLHAHQYTPFFYAALARRWGRRPHILFTEHGRHYPDHRRPKRVLANKFLLKATDRVTAVGQFVKDMLIANEGIAARRIEVIHNGIDPAKFAAARDEAVRRAVRAELQLGPEQLAILQVARFHPVKDHATALRAMGQVVQSVPQSVLLLAGDGELRDALGAMVDEMKLAEHVKFLGVRSDVPRLMAGADVFLLSSLSEGVSVTLLEAMAARLPIAATDVGGNGEVVVHHDTGLLSPRQDHQELANHLITLLRDEALRRRLGEAGHARLRSMFTQDRMHAAYADLYAHMTT